MIGHTVSHYKILEKLGEGGMGTVYKAEDIKLKRSVALKFLHANLTQEEDSTKRFAIEAQAASALDHFNICTIHEIDETEDGQLFICMAHYDGGTLKEKIKHGPLPIQEAVEVAIQIAQGLARAHEAGIVHRDIKPGNIIITDHGEVKIVDFGLAKLSNRDITKSTSPLGTVAYMSPEQIRGLSVDHRTDIWSLGVVLYEMLTAGLPFTGDYPEPMMYSIVNEPPKPLPEFMQRVPEGLQLLMNKVLSKNPEQRYQDASSLLADLQQLGKDPLKLVQPKPPRQKVRTKKRRRRRYLLLGSLAILAILTGLGIYIQIHKATSPEGIFTAEELKLIQQAKEREFVIIIAPFWGTGKEALQEGKVMQALIARKLYSELRQESRVKILNPELEDLPRTHENAKSLGERLNASLVIWGEVYSLRGEVEIQPYLTTTERLAGPWGSNILPSSHAMNVQLSEPDQLSFRKAKADELGNLALLVSAKYYQKTGNVDKALALLKRIEPSTSHSLALQGDIYAGQNKKDRADSLYHESLTLDSTNVRTYLRLSWLYHSQWLRETALKYAHKALELNNKLAETYELLVSLYNALGQTEQMFAAYEEGLRLSPQNANLYFLLGMHYAWSDYDKAIENFKKAIDLNPRHEWAYIMIGSCYRYQGKYDEAIQITRKAIAINPLEEAAHRFLGHIYRAQKKYKLAEKQFFKARDLAPYLHTPNWALSLLYQETGRYDEALKALIKGKELLPFAGWYYSNVARVYVMLGNYKKVVEVYQEALDAGFDADEAKIADLYFYLGMACEMRGNFVKAAEYYLRKMELPKTVHTAYNAARYYFVLNQLGRHREARKHLRSFVETYDRYPWGVTIIRYLLGELSETEFLAATNHIDLSQEKGRKCEAYYYMGKASLLKESSNEVVTTEDSIRARDYLNKCIDMNAFGNIETPLAQVELARLENADGFSVKQ